MGALDGKTALVTGGTSGIGHAVATGLAREGAHVTLLVRNRERGEAAAATIRKAVPKAKVALLEGDTSSMASIRRAAGEFLKSNDRLHVLVNGAGVFLPERTMTPEGVEATFATNYLGHYLLTNLLLDALKKGAPSRIINVASRYGNAKVDFDDPFFEHRKFTVLKAVAPTKLAQVLFTQELAERLAGTGITVNAVHPGLVARTHLLEQTGGFFRWFTNTVGGTPEKGAETVLWLATSPEGGTESGKMWAKRKPLKTPGQGSDPEARRRLWTLSETLVQANGQSRAAKAKPSARKSH